jgi:peptide/nickel transport system permease protein
VLRAFVRAPGSILALGMLLLILAVAVLAPPILGDYADSFDLSERFQGPSAEHLLGTDSLGRDIAARLLVATRLTVGLALVALSVGAAIGFPLGAIVSLMSPRPRMLLHRVIDTMISFPGVLIAIFVTAIVGPGIFGAVLGLGIAGSFSKARLTSTMAMSIGGSDYVAAARTLGVGWARVAFHHILPNMAETVLIFLTVTAGSTLVSLSGLSFLGLGVQAPAYDWGSMLTEGVGAFYLVPTAALGPAVAIGSTAVAFGLLGEGLARATNPALWTAEARSKLRRLDALPALDLLREHHENLRVPAFLAVENLSVEFPGSHGFDRVVDGVTFSLERAEILGIVGESGSGKTMTAYAIGQIVPHPGRVSGSIRLNGRDLATLPKREVDALLGTSLAMVFQDPTASTNPSIKIGTQMTEASIYHRHVTETEARAGAVSRLGEVGIGAPKAQLSRYPHELSGGMRQRVTVAMGLMVEPELLIADEPTTSLDVTIQAQLMALLLEINERHQTAIVLISHNIALISQYCSRTLVMYAGRVVEDIRTADLGHALHPYTRALIASIPDLERSPEVPLQAIRGSVPEATNLPTGCAFHPRCPLAMPRCADEAPPLISIGDRGRVACWAVSAIDL